MIYWYKLLENTRKIWNNHKSYITILDKNTQKRILWVAAIELSHGTYPQYPPKPFYWQTDSRTKNSSDCCMQTANSNVIEYKSVPYRALYVENYASYWSGLLSPFYYKTVTIDQIGSTSYVLPIRLSYHTLNRVIRVSKSLCWLATWLCVPLHHVDISVPKITNVIEYR